MNTDYIYRGAAIEAANDWKVKPDGEIFNAIKAAIKSKIEQVPAVDAEPRLIGQWVYNPDAVDWGLGAYVCSLCRCRNDNIPHNQEMARNPYMWRGSQFCPTCGARMRPEQDNA